MQGATNVALTAVQTLVDYARESEFRDRASTLADIAKAKKILFETRETEPFMRNSLRYIEWRVRETSWSTAKELHSLIQSTYDDLMESFQTARRGIVEIGSRRISSGNLILTHCHSSAVDSIFKLAKERGVNFRVIVTETRPVYQGRITASELLRAGIDTTMIVDSAVRSFIKRVDFVVVGADAITSEGNIVNKIGTSMVALAAQEARVPFYVITSLMKFDPQTIYGEFESIEERPASEVWLGPPEGLTIRNPAFDVTRRDYIHGIVCEEGIISPQSILEAVRRSYPWILQFEES